MAGQRIYMSRACPPGWTPGAPRAPGRYWYAEFRDTPPLLVTVEWEVTAGGDGGDRRELVFYWREDGPRCPVAGGFRWWKSSPAAPPVAPHPDA